MGAWRNVRISEWGGLNEDENPTAPKLGELSIAENVYHKGSTIGTRPGAIFEANSYDAAISGTPAVHGLYDYRFALNASRKLVAIAGTAAYETDSTTITLPGGGYAITTGQNNLWTFATFKDCLYGIGPATAGANGALLKWTGTGAATDIAVLDSAANKLSAKYLFQKWNYGFMAGFDGTAVDDNSMIVRYSALNDMDNWPVANTFGGTSAIGGFSSYGDEYLTGFGDWTDNKGDWLIVGSNRQLYSVVQTTDALTPFYVDSVIQNGLVNQHAFVSLGTDSGEAVYMSERGVHSLRQSQEHGDAQDSFLSWKIRTTWNTVNKNRLKYASGAYWPTEGIVLFLVSTGSNTSHDLILCLDCKSARKLNADEARWTIWRLNLPSSDKANIIVPAKEPANAANDPNGSMVAIGTTGGRVLKFSTTVFQDVSSSGGYSTHFRTADHNMNAPGLTKGMGDAWLSIQPGGDYKPRMTTYFDFGRYVGQTHELEMANAGAEWDTDEWDVGEFATQSSTSSVKLYGVGSGDSIAHDFIHTGTNEPFWIADFTYQVRPLGEGIGDLAE